MDSYVDRLKTAQESFVQSLTLADVRRKILGEGEGKVEERRSMASLPEGYRTDFRATVTGRAIYNYLRKRNLSPEVIRELKVGYSLQGDCNGAAIFPVFQKGELVFWQARRVLFQSNNKYYSSSLDKTVVYGYDWITEPMTYVVEGIFDAIALKPRSVGLLGKTISDHQIALLAEKNITEVRVVLDGDAWDKCRELAKSIREKLWTVRTVSALRLRENRDPGDYIGKPKTFLKRIVQAVVLY
jgi:DNA primase